MTEKTYTWVERDLPIDPWYDRFAPAHAVVMTSRWLHKIVAIVALPVSTREAMHARHKAKKKRIRGEKT